MSERDQIYNELVQYPIPEQVITYASQSSRAQSSYRRTTFDDLITLNLNELLPNLTMAEHRKKTNIETAEWINKTKQYGEIVNSEFQKQCDALLMKIQYSIEQEDRMRKFRPELVSNLPCDMQFEILSYLPSETRLMVLELRHPDTKEKMKKWKVNHLKTFYKEIVHNIYILKIRENYSRRCLSQVNFRWTLTNKDEYINEIFGIINMLKEAVPRDVDKYFGYKHDALKLYASIVYVNKKLVDSIKPKGKPKK